MQYNIEAMIESISNDGLIALRGDARSVENLVLRFEHGGAYSLIITTSYGEDPVPEDVWHRRNIEHVLLHGPAVVDIDELRTLLTNIEPLAVRLTAGHSIEWDGSNQWDGSNYVGILTIDAAKADEEIDQIIADHMDQRPPVQPSASQQH